MSSEEEQQPTPSGVSQEEQQPVPSGVSQEEQQPVPSGVSQEEQQPVPSGVSQEELASPWGTRITQGTGSKPPLKSKKKKHGGKASKTVSISPEQLKQLKREQREAKKHAWEQREARNARVQREVRNAREQIKTRNPQQKAIYGEILLILQNMHEWIFGDTTSLALALRAVRRRDLDGIMKVAQTSDEFFNLCERCGLFIIEPELREILTVPYTSDEWDTD